MIFSYRKTLARFRFFVLFILLTYLLYHALLIVTNWIQPIEKYKMPEGKAAKVFQHQHVNVIDSGSVSDRLRLFYWYGE
jgi:hypothetical protein